MTERIEDQLRAAYRVGVEQKRRRRLERAFWFAIVLLVVDSAVIVWGFAKL